MTTTTRPLPRPQEATCGRGMIAVESHEAAAALAVAYRSLVMLKEGQLLDFIAEQAFDQRARMQCEHAIAYLEDSMSPNLLCTVLPAYTRVEFSTDRSREGETQEGLLRDGAWGLYPERSDSRERRITTNGWEMFVNPLTTFTSFRVLEVPR